MVASVYYTSARLIDAVRVRASLPKSDSLYSDDEILQLATDELYDSVLPLIRNTKEEYLIYSHTIPVITNEQNYYLPERSTANGLRDLYFVDSSGNLFPMTRIGIDDKYDFQNSAATSQPYSYYLENDMVVIPAHVSANGGNLIMKFMIRVSALVSSDRIARITGIDRDTGIISFTLVPKIFGNDLRFDFTKTRSPHSILGIDVAVSAINFVANTMTFDPADIPAKLTIGDRVSLENETDLPQIPTEMHRYLIAKTVERVLEGIRDTEGLQNASIKSEQVAKSMNDLMSDRVQSAPLKVKNRSSFLRRMSNRRGY